MKALKVLFENNRKWAQEKTQNDPLYFKKLASNQKPQYLWIGCSDSRIPASEVVGLEPGELFVQRNIANLFPHTDFNSLSVLEYAVDHLNIAHVIVCGHYGCGGVKAAMDQGQHGIVDNWLRHIKDVYQRFQKELEAIEDEKQRYQRLVELNVLSQVMNICHTTIVHNAWARGQTLFVHGWVYDLTTGLLKDLNCCISSQEQVQEIYLTFNTKIQK